MVQREIHLEEIDKAEAIRYMGCKDGTTQAPLQEIIAQCEKELLQAIVPRYCYKVFDIREDVQAVRLVNASLLLKGESIRQHLQGCEKAVILCATLSGETDKTLRLGRIKGMTYALVLDALANAAIEQVCDAVEAAIMQEFPDYHHTWRFGVGYGDFPLSTQQSLLETIDAGKRIGVCATDSAMLTPSKSVTCVIGLSKKVTGTKKSCAQCTMREKCNFRKD